MLTPDGLLTGYLSTFGYGSWAPSTANEITVEFDMKNSIANFQVSRYNIGVNSLSQGSIVFTFKYT